MTASLHQQQLKMNRQLLENIEVGKKNGDEDKAMQGNESEDDVAIAEEMQGVTSASELLGLEAIQVSRR